MFVVERRMCWIMSERKEEKIAQLHLVSDF